LLSRTFDVEAMIVFQKRHGVFRFTSAEERDMLLRSFAWAAVGRVGHRNATKMLNTSRIVSFCNYDSLAYSSRI
jgi:hypothetical protein